MSRLRKVLYAVMLCVILGMAGITAQADEDALDFSRDGNSSIEVIVELKSPVKGALISLYQLQSYDAEHGFVWNAEYENCDISLDGLSGFGGLCCLCIVLGKQSVEVVLVLAVAEVAHHLAGLYLEISVLDFIWLSGMASRRISRRSVLCCCQFP